MNKVFSFFKEHYIKNTSPVANTFIDGLLYWREKVLLKVIYILFFTAIIAYIPSVILAVATKLWSIVIIDTLVYAVLFYLYLNKKLSVRLRAFTILSISYILGVILVLVVGPFGAGYLWLFVLPILAGILLERKSATNLLLINFVTLVLLGVVQYYIHPTAAIEFSFSVTSWIVISANFIFLNLIITFSINVLIRGLEETLEKERVMIASLEKQNKEMIFAKEGAEKADNLKSEFLAQMSHEIRTPINTILSFTSLIKSEIEDKLDEGLKEYFGSVSNAGKRIIRTVDLILNMSEIQAKTFKPIKRNVDLCNDVCKKVIVEYKTIAHEKGIQLYVDNRSGNCSVYADEYTLNQILANLLDNAIKYTERGEVKISLYNQNEQLIITVEDTGIGISEEYLKNMFATFSQEDKGYTRKYEGNGLGLSLVKKYCEINNVEIKVESQKGVGTKFSLFFNSVASAPEKKKEKVKVL